MLIVLSPKDLYEKMAAFQHLIHKLYIQVTKYPPFHHKGFEIVFQAQHNRGFQHTTMNRFWLHFQNLQFYTCPKLFVWWYMGDEYVIRFNISMNNGFLVEISDSTCNFKQYLSYLVYLAYLSCNTLVYFSLRCALLRHILQQLSLKLLSQRLCLHVLHNKVEMLCVIGRRKAFDKMRMRTILMNFML